MQVGFKSGITSILILSALVAFGARAAEPEEEVLIRYKDIVVTAADFQAELETIPEQYRANIAASGERIHQLLDKIFTYRVLAKEAQEQGLEQNPEVQQELKLEKEEILGKARLRQLRQQALADNPDFEALARERYQANPEKYQQPERVKVSHILIKPEERSEEEARELAEQVRQLALTDEKPFSELALQYSEDPSLEKNKGDLGFIAKGMTTQSFEEAAFALEQPGAISPVVKSRFGFHIIRLEERQAPKTKSFAEVKESLVEDIKATHLNQVVQTHLNQIRNAEGIQMNREAWQKLKPTSPTH
ncbi:peptidylprolyl isomerase [Nitrosococcus watsonii]|uniref:peptidylprolyl isomerase n=1 Tax=Nitrosococcus watsoni (strain C-113) TaxID=105559 RepID=D8K926_NITWC|nr:peptidylprolyl isomerase [Nitrosococcus watsonii]ADJ29169.1 PpiC-type peptidyl-prolyl cis-trans isomerase [Nitrosococcus watsonii C-113]